MACCQNDGGDASVDIEIVKEGGVLIKQTVSRVGNEIERTTAHVSEIH